MVSIYLTQARPILTHQRTLVVQLLRISTGPTHTMSSRKEKSRRFFSSRSVKNFGKRTLGCLRSPELTRPELTIFGNRAEACRGITFHEWLHEQICTQLGRGIEGMTRRKENGLLRSWYDYGRFIVNHTLRISCVFRGCVKVQTSYCILDIKQMTKRKRNTLRTSDQQQEKRDLLRIDVSGSHSVSSKPTGPV